ncbi:MAG: hypothetical protein AB7K24_22525 [Gemmataceae bacterium]
MTPLHHIGDWVRAALLAMPLPLVRLVFVLVPVVVLVWVMCLPREVTSPVEGNRRWDENLKLWAAVALLIQIAIYAAC